MKRNSRAMAVILVMIAVFGLTLTGCKGTSTVDLNQYVSVTANGYNGYGTIYATIDVDRIIEDYADKLNKNAGNQIMGANTPAIAAELAFEMYDPFDLEFQSENSAGNGDKISFVWDVDQQAISEVQKYLDVNFEYKNFDYVVEGLQELAEVDPFEAVELKCYGLSGAAYADRHGYAEFTANGNNLRIELIIPEATNLSNGDTVLVGLEADDEYYAKNFGIILSRKEAEIEIQGLNYYPVSSPSEIFEYLTEESYVNAMEALMFNYKNYAGNVTAECIGALLYYCDTPDPESYANNGNNQLVLIYHLDNGIVPGGWYTYMAPNRDVYIGYQQQEDGSQVKMTMTSGDSPLGYGNMNYYAEYTYLWGGPAVPTQFDYDGLSYAGHYTIEECLDALDANLINGATNLFGQTIPKNYNHMIVTDSLKAYTTEY